METDKAKIQRIWDAELIAGWDEEGKTKINSVVFRFLNRIAPEIQKKDCHGNFITPYCEIADLLISLSLRRCLDVNSKGDLCFQAGRTDVIGFIHARCEKMSMDLINGELKPIVLLNIDSYKWKKVNASASQRFRAKQRQEEVKSNCVKPIKARSLSKKHDWQTVK